MFLKILLGIISKLLKSNLNNISKGALIGYNHRAPDKLRDDIYKILSFVNCASRMPKNSVWSPREKLVTFRRYIVRDELSKKEEQFDKLLSERYKNQSSFGTPLKTF